MKRITNALLISTILVIAASVVCFAEEGKTFTPAQKKTLEDKLLAMRVSENSFREFVNYLAVEYKVDGEADSWQIAKDNTGFVKKEVPKVEDSKNDARL